MSSSLFLSHNTDLGPPYRILVDTNFINFSIQNKIELVQGMMDCLMAKCIPTITDCVLAELEKLGPKYRLALKWVEIFFPCIQDIEVEETDLANVGLQRTRGLRDYIVTVSVAFPKTDQLFLTLYNRQWYICGRLSCPASYRA